MRHIITQTSPYTGLENGVFLERVGSNRSTMQSRGASFRRRSQKNKVPPGLAIFIGLAILSTCFLGSTLYVTAFAGKNHTMQVQDKAAPARIIDFRQYSKNPPIDPTEKYLAYLPHSGFHNQRIALENAMVLARILNRTLIVPPMRLGKGIIRYFPFDRLYSLVSLSGKDHMLHCNSPPKSWTSLPVECLDHFDYTFIPWNWMMNLSSVESDQKLVYRWNASAEWLHESLGITGNDTFALKDSSHLQYRFVDSDPLDTPGPRYKEAVAVSLLDQVPHRLLQIGTLFGSSRIRLRRRKNLEARGEIRAAMEFTNEILLRTADTIKEKLGNLYLAAHLRLDDGRFASQSEETVRVIWWRLLRDALEFSDEDISELESNLGDGTLRAPPQMPVDVVPRMPHVPLPPFVASEALNLPCRGELHSAHNLSSLNLPLFISTDVSDPRNHPSLRILLDTFPCVFFLSDFSRETSSLDNLKSGYDGLHLKEFLIPFLDAIVASRAHEMVGTRGSTFSQFMEDVLWRRYHGYEIQQRG